MEDFFKMFDNINESHRKQEEEFKRLKADTPRSVSVGDTVLVAVGLLGHGFKWIRKECEVMAVGNVSVQIRFEAEYVPDKDYYVYWIDPALITDVISKAKNKEERGMK